VLTIVILVSHWGVEELGDALNAGVDARECRLAEGRTSARIVSTSSKAHQIPEDHLRSVADISQYPVGRHRTRREHSGAQNRDALQVSVVYGIVLVIGAIYPAL